MFRDRPGSVALDGSNFSESGRESVSLGVISAAGVVVVLCDGVEVVLGVLITRGVVVVFVGVFPPGLAVDWVGLLSISSAPSSPASAMISTSKLKPSI